MRPTKGVAQLGPRLLAFRQERQISQSAAAALIGARKHDWARWKRGVTQPGPGWRARLNALLAGSGSIPNVLQQYRQAHALTQIEAAQRLGVGRRTYQRWEEGDCSPGRVNRGRIWRLLDREMAPFRTHTKEAA